MSEKYQEIIKKAAAAKKKEAEKRKEKSIEKATEIIMEEMLKESGIHGSPCNMVHVSVINPVSNSPKGA